MILAGRNCFFGRFLDQEILPFLPFTPVFQWGLLLCFCCLLKLLLQEQGIASKRFKTDLTSESLWCVCVKLRKLPKAKNILASEKTRLKPTFEGPLRFKHSQNILGSSERWSSRNLLFDPACRTLVKQISGHGALAVLVLEVPPQTTR